MEQKVFYLCFCIAVFFAIFFSVWAIIRSKNKKRAHKVFTYVQILTVGIFISAVCLLIPVYLYHNEYIDDNYYVRPCLLAFHNALRIFILDTNYELVKEACSACIKAEWLYVTYLFSVCAIYVAAPILTFTNVLALFRNLRDEIRFSSCIFRKICIMSCLNERSMALAESVVDEYKKERKIKPLIVFTDVFKKNEEENYELILRAYNIRAVCLKKDVAHLNLKGKFRRMEIFLMGDDESENLSQAIAIKEIYTKKRNISLYVFAGSPGAAYVMDSFGKNPFRFNKRTKKKITDSPGMIFDLEKGLHEIVDLDKGFRVKRFNSYNLLVQKTLRDQTYILGPIERMAKQTKKISIMIIGLGEYGKEFLKTSLWFFQEKGYELQVNVFDNSEGDRAKGELYMQCPDIIENNDRTIDGDSKYSIRFYTGIDCYSEEFEKAFREGESGKRLAETQLAFVTLGDDDKNIEVAMNLRRIFDNIHNVSADDAKGSTIDDAPMICAVVFDEKKAKNLGAVGNAGSNLKNYRNQPYNVRFIGNISAQYSYKVIKDELEIEKSAFAQHVEWVAKQRQLRHCYMDDKSFRTLVLENYDGKVPYWGDADWYILKEMYRNCNKDQLESLKKRKPQDEYVDFDKFDKDQVLERIVKEIEKYMEYEYFRFSSIARAVHKERMEAKYPCLAIKKSHVCDCENCNIRRETEHMRWNAYMRTIGYKYGDTRCDRAKRHCDIKSWDKLEFLEKYKD